MTHIVASVTVVAYVNVLTPPPPSGDKAKTEKQEAIKADQAEVSQER